MNYQSKNTTKVKKGQLVELENFGELAALQRSLDKGQIKFVIDTIAPTLNENELMLFLYKARRLSLDPLNGEIFAYTVEENVNGKKVRRLVTIVARDGKRVVAERTGKVEWIKTEAIYTKSTKEGEVNQVPPWAGGILWGATCTLKRKDIEQPFNVTVPLSEYRQDRYIWKNKPETMIKKVAESQCLSMAFPELAGVYDESERFDVNGKKELLEIEGGDKPASSAQLKTIESLGGEVKDGMTIQEAAELIKEFGIKKGGTKNE